MTRRLGGVLGWAAVPLAVVAGLGWLYLLRGVAALALGPDVRGALPLEQLAHHDGQPLARLVAAWVPAGAAAGAALAAGTRRSSVARALAVGFVGWLVLVLSGAGSDAAAISASVPSHLAPQLTRPGTWSAAVLLFTGALAAHAEARRGGR
jgi:hypothetical protein